MPTRGLVLLLRMLMIVTDAVTDSSDGHVEGDLFKWASQSVAFDPAPVAAIVPSTVLGINLCRPIKLLSAGQFAQHFFGQRLLRWGSRGIFLAWNHDHA